MSTKTSIEWTERTWNPTIGCDKISPGCRNCYAEIMANRLRHMGMEAYENGFELKLLPERLQQPLKIQKPTLFFVNSMSDLFHTEIPFDYLDLVFDVILKSPQHTFQILTKRAEQMRDYFATNRDSGNKRKVPDNAWLGVTVEDRKYGIPRIEILRQVPAKTRFISFEPLLEELGLLDLSQIHWAVVGGESGSRARPMKESWIHSIKKSCDNHQTVFFFKQWGTWGADGIRRNKKINGRLWEGMVWDNYPEAV